MAPHPQSSVCLLCGCTKYDVVENFPDPKAHVTSYEVRRCAECNFLFTFPQPASDIIGEYYEEDYSSWHLKTRHSAYLDSPWQRRTYSHYFGYLNFRDKLTFFKQIPAAILSFFHSGGVVVPHAEMLGKLLDVGCGSGQFLGLMAHLGWDVQGVEPSEAACRLAAQRWGIHPINGWIEDVIETDFDLISMCGVIEHLYDPLDTLAKIRDRLRDGGRVFITTHDISGPGPTLFGPKWVGWEIPQHLYFFDQASMRRALQKTGFKQIVIKRQFRSTDLFNTLEIGAVERYASFFLSRLFVTLHLSGGMVVEARK